MIPFLVAALLLSASDCPENLGVLGTAVTGSDIVILYPFQVSGSAATRFDVVFVGDGFTDSPEDVARFDDFIDRAVKALSSAPYRRCAFNLYWVRLKSNDSGADHVAENDPIFDDGTVPFPLCADTPLNTQFGAPERGSVYDDYRYLYTATEDRCEEAAEIATHDCDLIVVLVNDATYGGAAWGKSPDIPFVTVSACEEFEHVLLHEMGHQVAALGDEYGGWSGCYTATWPDEPDHPNLTVKPDSEDPKWKVDEDAPIPTDLDGLREKLPEKTEDELKAVVGMWEGAAGYDRCVYRPQYTCRMREEVPFFCRVCEEAVAAAMTAACPAIEPVTLDWGQRIPLTCIAGSRVRIPLPPCLKCLFTKGAVNAGDFEFSKRSLVRVEIDHLPGVETVRVVEYPSTTVVETGPDPGSPAGVLGASFAVEFVAKPCELYFLEFTPKRCRVVRFSLALRLYVDGVQVY